MAIDCDRVAELAGPSLSPVERTLAETVAPGELIAPIGVGVDRNPELPEPDGPDDAEATSPTPSGPSSPSPLAVSL
jgi:hypothetical protein